jgi:hypothetical protein
MSPTSKTQISTSSAASATTATSEPVSNKPASRSSSPQKSRSKSPQKKRSGQSLKQEVEKEATAVTKSASEAEGDTREKVEVDGSDATSNVVQVKEETEKSNLDETGESATTTAADMPANDNSQQSPVSATEDKDHSKSAPASSSSASSSSSKKASINSNKKTSKSGKKSKENLASESATTTNSNNNDHETSKTTTADTNSSTSRRASASTSNNKRNDQRDRKPKVASTGSAKKEGEHQPSSAKAAESAEANLSTEAPAATGETAEKKVDILRPFVVHSSCCMLVETFTDNNTFVFFFSPMLATGLKLHKPPKASNRRYEEGGTVLIPLDQ